MLWVRDESGLLINLVHVEIICDETRLGVLGVLRAYTDTGGRDLAKGTAEEMAALCAALWRDLGAGARVFDCGEYLAEIRATAAGGAK